MNAVRHLFFDELVVQFVHQGLNNTGCVGTRDVAVQPALGVRDHGNGRTGTTDREAFSGQLLDQRSYLGLFADHELDVGTHGEANVTFGELVSDITQLADGVDVHLTLGTGANGPDLITALGNVTQNTGTGTIVIAPRTKVLLQHRVHVRKRIRYTTLDRHTRCRHNYLRLMVKWLMRDDHSGGPANK